LISGCLSLVSEISPASDPSFDSIDLAGGDDPKLSLLSEASKSAEPPPSHLKHSFRMSELEAIRLPAEVY
jgi:hypothetical protein